MNKGFIIISHFNVSLGQYIDFVLFHFSFYFIFHNVSFSKSIQVFRFSFQVICQILFISALFILFQLNIIPLSICSISQFVSFSTFFAFLTKLCLDPKSFTLHCLISYSVFNFRFYSFSMLFHFQIVSLPFCFIFHNLTFQSLCDWLVSGHIVSQ